MKEISRRIAEKRAKEMSIPFLPEFNNFKNSDDEENKESNACAM